MKKAALTAGRAGQVEAVTLRLGGENSPEGSYCPNLVDTIMSGLAAARMGRPPYLTLIVPRHAGAPQLQGTLGPSARKA